MLPEKIQENNISILYHANFDERYINQRNEVSNERYVI
jgi:hypothetical protein